MARRFTFRFETMLRIRRQREDEHKRIVAARLREIAGVNRQIGSLQRQIHEEEDAIRTSQMPGTIDLQQAIRHRHWLGHLHRCLVETQGRMRGLESQLAQERAALAEASKQRKILDKLKERQWRRHQMEQERREAKEADEQATLRHAHRNRLELVDMGSK